MTDSNRNWLDSINRQVNFYHRSNRKRRTEPGYPWRFVERQIKSGQISTLEWLSGSAEPLWEARSLLNDELSRFLFDAAVVLRLTGHQRFYFPRIDFDDFVEILGEKPFTGSDLPRDFCGSPLELFDIRLKERPDAAPIKIVTFKELLILFNSYRQYFVRRNSVNIFPGPGDIVLDCGACIGDISLLFAGLVAMRGEVHSFDPIPLHARYCRLQASLNPSLAHILHVNELAVGNRTFVTKGNKSDSDKIEPGGLAINSFASTSLDDYTGGRLNRVDFIKMDIEGSETEALDGAAKIIREFKPKLAICAYHKPNDLWEIPIRLKSLNQGYELYFGHHSPIPWESVFYAIQR